MKKIHNCSETDGSLIVDIEREYDNKMRHLQLEDYEKSTPMNADEKQALHKWVASGHSICKYPESKYVCLVGVYPPPMFLDVYRLDRELEIAMQGMS